MLNKNCRFFISIWPGRLGTCPSEPLNSYLGNTQLSKKKVNVFILCPQKNFKRQLCLEVTEFKRTIKVYFVKSLFWWIKIGSIGLDQCNGKLMEGLNTLKPCEEILISPSKWWRYFTLTQWNTILLEHTNIILKSTILCYPHKVSL